jgi:hypothetical protein
MSRIDPVHGTYVKHISSSKRSRTTKHTDATPEWKHRLSQDQIYIATVTKT